MNAKYINKDEHSNSFFELAVTVQMSTVLPLYFLSVTKMSSIYLFAKICLYIFYAYNLYKIAESKYIKHFLFGMMAIILLYIFNYFLFPNNRNALFDLLPDIIIQVIAITNAFLITESKKLIEYLKLSSRITFYLAVFFATIIIAYNINIDYISFSNGILFASIFFMADTFYENKKTMLYAAVLALLLLAFCSRSSLLYWSIALLFLLIKFASKIDTRKTLFWVILLPILLIPLFIYWTPILLWIYNLLCKIGINSRTLYKIIDGSITDLNGRDEIYPLMISKIRANPWFGYGIGSPNVFNTEYFYKWTGKITYIGSGAHNGILACAVEFGIIPALLFVFFNLKMIIKILCTKFSKEDEIVFTILLASGVIRVLIGATYWQTINYALLIGFYNRKKHICSKYIKRESISHEQKCN